MAGRKPAQGALSEQVRQALGNLVARHTTGQPKAHRARIILKAAEGTNPTAIASELTMSMARAAVWRARWLRLAVIGLDDWSGEARLADLPRPGAPSGLSADQRCPSEPLACQAPETADRPISHWTGHDLADERMERGIVEHLSPRHAARLPKKGACDRP